MVKTLRLGLAMGGGVSLGTFSGAALGQALKLLIARGPYEEVKIDVFSGASAGSMSLGLMLRALVHADPDEEAKARALVKEEFATEWAGLSADRQKDLVRAQVMKRLQEEVWVEKVDLDKLLGKVEGGSNRKLRHVGSVLDRGVVDELAKEYFLWDGGPVDLSQKRLLAERVLFASTLTSLVGSIADARREFESAAGALFGLLDGMRSKLHSEMRVYDLNFEDVPEEDFSDVTKHPRRWCRYHASVERLGVNGTLMNEYTWKKIAATCVACGAFPFAFEPVVLNRGYWEIPDFPFGTEKSYPASFVDGGTFNNEPIREAFRMASFIDAQDPHGDYHRRILFVDPNVEHKPLTLRVPMHQEWFLEDANIFGRLDGVDLRRRSTLDRLMPHVGQMLGMVISQGSRIEGDKVFRTRDRFALRRDMRLNLSGTLSTAVTVEELSGLIEFCSKHLGIYRRKSEIPPTSVKIETELDRVIAEEGSEELKQLRPKIVGFVSDPSSATSTERALWLRLLTFVAVDLIMDLSGKQHRAQLIAIAPYRDIEDAKNLKPCSLPGGVVFGFGGFTSLTARQYDVRVADYCAQLFLEKAELIEKSALGDFPEWSDEEKEAFAKDLERGMTKLGRRISETIKTSHLLRFFPGLNGLVKNLIASKVAAVVQNVAAPSRPATTYELRVRVPDKSYEWDGKGSIVGDQDIAPVTVQHLDPKEEGTGFYLITYPTWDGEKWTGHHVVNNDTRHLKVDRNNRTRHLKVDRNNRTRHRIELPPPENCDLADYWPNPIFVADVRGVAEKKVPATIWKLFSGVRALEDEL